MAKESILRWFKAITCQVESALHSVEASGRGQVVEAQELVDARARSTLLDVFRRKTPYVGSKAGAEGLHIQHVTWTEPWRNEGAADQCRGTPSRGF